MPLGLGRRALDMAKNVGENYVMPVVREAGRQVFHPNDIDSMPVEKRPMQYYDFLNQQQRQELYPNAPVDVPPSPTPKVPDLWYRSNRQAMK